MSNILLITRTKSDNTEPAKNERPTWKLYWTVSPLVMTELCTTD